MRLAHCVRLLALATLSGCYRSQVPSTTPLVGVVVDIHFTPPRSFDLVHLDGTATVHYDSAASVIGTVRMVRNDTLWLTPTQILNGRQGADGWGALRLGDGYLPVAWRDRDLAVREHVSAPGASLALVTIGTLTTLLLVAVAQMGSVY